MKPFFTPGHVILHLVSADPDTTHVVRSSLGKGSRGQFSFAESTTVDAALGFIRDNPVDAILLDHGPEEDGVLNLIRMRKAHPELPVLLISSRGNEQWAVKAIQAGAADYLTLDGVTTLLPSAIRLAIERTHVAWELERLNSNLVGIVSHDLRSPTGNILGYADLLLSGDEAAESPESRRRWVVGIRDNARYMLQLIHDLLDTVRIEAGKIELVLGRHRAGDIIKESLTRCQFAASCKGVQLEVSPSLEDPEIILDREKMVQVLINLITNAIKFSPGGTTVTVGASLVAGSVDFTVQDRGHGILESEVHALFKKFSRTSTRPTAGEKGTGLGLYIVNEFVKSHGGSVRVQTRPGAGSTFTVSLRQTGPL